jgi:uncharacterized protein YukE
MSDQITYNRPAIDASADSVIQNANAMMNEKEDVANHTNALQASFAGINATTYAEHNQQFLGAFDNLIHTVINFGKTVHVVNDSAGHTDATLAQMV